VPVWYSVLHKDVIQHDLKFIGPCHSQFMFILITCFHRVSLFSEPNRLELLGNYIKNVYRVYVTFLDKLQGWVSHTHQGQCSYNCPQTFFIVQHPSSSDISLLDIYLPWLLKSLVYSATIENEQPINHPNFAACQTICNHLGTFACVRHSVIRCDHACIHSLEDILSICCELFLDKQLELDSY
jgi:hypothetical protein